MAEINYKAIFQYRRGSSAEWESVNPILREGEPGLDTTLHKIKIGDGVTPWNQLEFQEEQMGEIDFIQCGNSVF